MATAPRRTVPRGAWVLLPLVAGLAYAAAHALLGRSATLRELVPPDAIETQRFRDLSVLDAVTGPSEPPTSAWVGARLNLPGLPGVDRTRPLLVALVAPESAPTSELLVLPVADAGTVERTFADPAVSQRHAGYLDVRGDHALAGTDRAAVRRRRPSGSLWPEELGEDWARLVEWPRFVDHALERRAEGPFRRALEAVGVDVERAVAAPGAPHGEPVSFGRLPIVREAWSRVGLHGWADRVRVTLVPAAGGALAAALADARGEADPPPPTPPPYVDGPRLWVRGARGRRALALALRDAGVRFPAGVSLESYRLDAPGGLTLWAESSSGDAWTIALAGPPDALPDLAAFGLPVPGATPVPLAAGVAPLTAPLRGDAPPGSVARGVARDGALAVVALGPHGERAATAGASALGGPSEVPAAAAGETVLAWFRVPQAFASRLLGDAVEPGGLLAPLRDGDVEGTVSTDGTRLLIDLRRR